MRFDDSVFFSDKFHTIKAGRLSLASPTMRAAATNYRSLAHMNGADRGDADQPIVYGNYASLIGSWLYNSIRMPYLIAQRHDTVLSEWNGIYSKYRELYRMRNQTAPASSGLY